MQYTMFAVKDNADAQLDSDIGASTLLILLKAGQGDLFPQPYSGTTSSGGTNVTLNKTGIGATGITIGDFIENVTDGSHAYVTSVAADVVTTTELQSGSDNLWQNGDSYRVNSFVATGNKRDDQGNVIATEKIKIIGRSGDNLTVDPSGRGFDGSVAMSFVADDYFSLFVVSRTTKEIQKAFTDLSQQIDLKASTIQLNSALAARSWKDAVVVATTVAGTLATSFENGDTVDGIVLATGNRILIKNQAAPAENGIYVVNASGAPTRATDFDTTAEVTGAAVTIIKGSSNADTAWICTSDSPVVGTDPINFAQVGASLNKASNSEALAAVDDTKYITPLKAPLAAGKRALTLYEDILQGFATKILDNSGLKIRKATTTQVDGIQEFQASATAPSAAVNIVYMPTGNCFVVVGRLSGSGVAIVGKITETGAITFGTPVTFVASLASAGVTNTRCIGACYDSANDKIVLSYSDAGNANNGRVIVGTVDQTALSIVFGTAVVLNTYSTPANSHTCVYDPVNGKVAVITDDNSSAKGVVATVSGTGASGTVSLGTPVNIGTSVAYGYEAVYDPTSGKILIGFLASATVFYVATISGTSISVGAASATTNISGNGLPSRQIGMAYDPVSTKILIVGTDSSIGGLSAYVATISGTTVTFGTKNNFEVTGGSMGDLAISYDEYRQRFVVTCQVGSNFYYNIATISGTTVTFVGKVTISASWSVVGSKSFYHPWSGRTIIAYARSSTFKVSALQLSGDYPDFLNAVGVMQEAGSSGQIKTTSLLGGICAGFTGKTAGDRAYIQKDLTVGSTVTNYPIGRFISDTELLVSKNV